jgi:hypothetical protein
MPLDRRLLLALGQSEQAPLISSSERPGSEEALAMRDRIVLLNRESRRNPKLARQVSTTLQK